MSETHKVHSDGEGNEHCYGRQQIVV